ncbi:hypothetical protein NKG94_46570 [Micromonospora sp. M12]
MGGRRRRPGRRRPRGGPARGRRHPRWQRRRYRRRDASRHRRPDLRAVVASRLLDRLELRPAPAHPWEMFLITDQVLVEPMLYLACTPYALAYTIRAARSAPAAPVALSPTPV